MKQVPENEKMVLGHLFTAAGILAACIWVITESLKISGDALKKDVAKIYTVPGLLPLVVGTLAVGMIFFVILYYLKRASFGRERFRELARSFYVPAAVFGLLFIYIYILIPGMPFLLATFIFTCLFMAVFRAASLLRIVIISLVYTAITVFLFVKVVGVRFPVSLFTG